MIQNSLVLLVVASGVLFAPCLSFAQEFPDRTVLIRNVTLINQEGQEKDAIVSIVIKNRKLDLVTQDDISVESAWIAADAQGRILVGQLSVGESPSFIILERDPRTDFDVLLDTATSVRFAMRDGEVVVDRLPRATDDGVEPKRSGWLAYTPPPLALPSSYLDTSKWNRWETRYISGIFVAALVVDRQHWVSQDGESESQVEDLDEFDGGEIRGFRFGAVGTLNFRRAWVYTLFFATNAFDKGFDSRTTGDFTWFDWRLDIPTFGNTTLSIGKQKEPISMERIVGLTFQPMQERTSVSDALLLARNVGAVLSGSALDTRMSWAGGVFNDWLDTGKSFSNSANQVIARVTGLPLVTEDESNLLHLGLGLRYSDAREGLQYATGPEFNQAPLFVNTDPLDVEGFMTYDMEAAWRWRFLWFSGEYVISDVDAPGLGNPVFKGYHLTGSWALGGEMRPYNRKSGLVGRLPVARTVNNGGWGTWEASARWSSLDLSDGSVDGGEMQIASLGLGWWLTPVFNFNVNYRHIILDRFGVTGHSDGINGRVVLMLE